MTAEIPRWSESHGPRPSAVAMLFMPPLLPEGPARLVLTRRSTTVRSHKGQIGLAGGRRDPGELSPGETVLREVEEELGISTRHVLLHGAMPPLQALDGSSIIPIVATAAIMDEEVAPSVNEVAEMILAPWNLFLESRGRLFSFTLFGVQRSSWLFEVPPSVKVWGLTAEMLWKAHFA